MTFLAKNNMSRKNSVTAYCWKERLTENAKHKNRLSQKTDK
jgi:hypothetical protein